MTDVVQSDAAGSNISNVTGLLQTLTIAIPPRLALDFAGLRLPSPSQAPQLKVRSSVVSKVDG